MHWNDINLSQILDKLDIMYTDSHINGNFIFINIFQGFILGD